MEQERRIRVCWGRTLPLLVCIFCICSVLLVVTCAQVGAQDSDVFEHLKWRKADPVRTERYLWFLLASVVVCAGLYLGRQGVVVLLARWRSFWRRTALRKTGPSGIFPRKQPVQGGSTSNLMKSIPTIASNEKARAVVRLIQGEDVDDVAEELGVSTALLRDWVERFLTAGKQALGPATWSSRSTRGRIG